jgi:hypothetical protein
MSGKQLPRLDVIDITATRDAMHARSPGAGGFELGLRGCAAGDVAEAIAGLMAESGVDRARIDQISSIAREANVLHDFWTTLLTAGRSHMLESNDLGHAR